MSSYILLAIFLQITKTEVGKVISYTILASACFIAFLIVNRFLPETKDIPINECVRLVLEARTKGCRNLKINNMDNNSDYTNS